MQARIHGTMLLATAIAGLSAAGAATAQDWYLGVGLTAGRLDQARQTVANAPAPGGTLLLGNAIETGYGGQLAVGVAFDRVRAEIEFGRQGNDSDSYTTISPFVATLPQDGKTDIRRAMANAYYDFREPGAAWRPYLGLGIGTAEVSVVRINAVAAAPTAPPQKRVDFDDSGFAWQAMAGVEWRLSPRVSIATQYRRFDRGDVEGTDMRGEAVRIGVATHNVDVALRARF